MRLNSRVTPLYPIAIYLLIASRFLTNYGTHNMIYYIEWTRGFLQGNVEEIYHLGKYSTGDDLTVPYTPLSLYFVSLTAVILRIFLGNSDLTYVIAVNLTGVVCTIIVYLLILKWFNGSKSLNIWLYLLSPAVLLISPILGYEDTISAVFVIAAIKYFSQEKYVWFGTFSSAGILTKQLALIPIFSLLVLLIVTRKYREILQSIKWMIPIGLVTLAPFILSGHFGTYIVNQLRTSVHTMTSANSANLPWLVKLAVNSSTNGYRTSLSSESFGGTISNEYLRVSLYVLLAISVLVIIVLTALKLVRSKYSWETSSLVLALTATLTYYMLSMGVHQNHLFLALPVAYCLTKEHEFKAVYFSLSISSALEQFSAYGLGIKNENSSINEIANHSLANFISLLCFAGYTFSAYRIFAYFKGREK